VAIAGFAPALTRPALGQEAESGSGDNGAPPPDTIERDEDRVWSVRLGVAGGAEPAYPGADEYDSKPFPIIDVRWGRLIFISDREGVGFNVANGRHLRVGAAITYDYGRDEDDSTRLAGLGEVDATIEFGGLVVFTVFGARLDGQFRQDIFGGHNGWLVDFGAGYGAAIGELLDIDFHLGATWASEDYLQAYFGVDAAQSAASGLPAFDPAAGIRDVAAETRATLQLGGGWFAEADFRVSQLLGDAGEDSPVTVEEVQLRGWLGLGYSF
jgi:outer membrane scaffolding protein for murein synthesis (MipA/OmpV family)